MNFMKPKGVQLTEEDDGSGLAVGAIALQPKIEENPEILEVLGNPEEEKEEPEIPEITGADLGDLEASPGLGSYRDFGKKNSPQRLLELSSTLRARGQFQRALLALERVVDTSNADSKVIDEAATGIAALTPTLPRWNIDVTAEISLTLNIGSARTPSESLKKAALEVADLIRKSSSDQLEIIPKITSSESSDAPEDSPVALWLATNSEAPASSAVVTLKISDDESAMIDEFAIAVFQAVRGHLARQGYPNPLPLRASGRDYLSVHVTRLMWRDFAHSLQEMEKAAAEAENDEN
jgi:hypothetical protein